MRNLTFAAGMVNLGVGMVTDSNWHYIAAVCFFVASLLSPEEL